MAAPMLEAPTQDDERSYRFWRHVREGYAGGLGARFSELATQHRIPATTIRTRAIRENWQQDAEVSDLERTIRVRAKELMREANDYRVDRVQARLFREFGTEAPVPSMVALRALFPRVAMIEHNREQVIPIHGLKRRCYAPGCGALTTTDPCGVCGALAHPDAPDSPTGATA